MNFEKLEEVFRSNSEMESARLLSGNFDSGSASLIKPHVPKEISTYIDLAIKHKQHLSIQHMSFTASLDKLLLVDSRGSEVFNGKASKFLVYSGEKLDKSKTLKGTVDELVSFNEVNYFIKLYPWWVKTVNPAFQEYVSIYRDSSVFIHNSNFDLNLLKDKEDVKSVTPDKIVLTDNTILKIIKV